MLFEPLEPRYLLSADLMAFAVDMANDGDDLTLTFEEANRTLRLLDNLSGAIVAEQSLEETDRVVVTGSDGDDRLVIDYTVEFYLPFGITFDAGGGFDQLILMGGEFASLSYAGAGEGGGLLSLDNGQQSESIRLSGVESITEATGAESRSITLSGADSYMLTGAEDASSAVIESLEQSFAFGASGGQLSIDVGDASLGMAGIFEAESVLMQAGEIDHTGRITAQGSEAAAGSVRFDAETITSTGVVEAFGGDVIFAAGPEGLLNVAGTLDVSSLDSPGGSVHLTGGEIEVARGAVIDARGNDGGEVRIGGDVRGQGVLPTAQETLIAFGALIDVSANEVGDGGSVVVWADGHTGFGGEILARGGSGGGDGGFAEVSGRETLAFRGNVDLSAPFGATGTLLLDPENVTIVAGSGGDDDAELPNISGGTDNFTISQDALEGLAPTAHVVIEATNNITLSSLGGGTLNLAATTGSVTLTADADDDGSGAFIFANTADTIATAGGDLTISGASLTLGNFDVGAGTLTLTATGDSIALRNIAAGNLIVTTGGTEDDHITQAVGTSVVVANATTLDVGAANITLGNTGNSVSMLNIAGANHVTIVSTGAVTLGELNFNGTFTLTAGTVIAERDADFTLTGTTLTIDDGTSRSIQHANVGNFELTGGASANTFEVSGFSAGTAKLTGSGGDNTYALGDNWGAVEVIAGTGNELLDFTGHSGTLKASADLETIESSDGSTLTQSTPITEIDLTLTGALVTTAFTGLLTFNNRLKDQIKELENQLPLLSRFGGDGNIARLTGLIDSFTDLQEAVDGAVDDVIDGTTLSVSDLIAKLKDLPDLPESLGLDIPTERGLLYQGSGILASDDPIDLLLPIDFNVARTLDFDLDLGAEAEIIGIEIDAVLEVVATLTANLQLGIATGALDSPADFDFFVASGGTVALGVDVGFDAGDDVVINIGFLKGTIEKDAINDVSFSGTVTVTLEDVNGNGRLSLGDLADEDFDDLLVLDFDSAANLDIDIDVDLTLGKDN